MENFPSAHPNKVEESPEKILSSEEILAVFSEFSEGYTVTRELSDEKGIHFMEAQVPGEKEGEVTEYQYLRKGEGRNYHLSTVIHVVFYEDGIPVSSDMLATLNEETGEWEKL